MNIVHIRKLEIKITESRIGFMCVCSCWSGNGRVQKKGNCVNFWFNFELEKFCPVLLEELWEWCASPRGRLPYRSAIETLPVDMHALCLWGPLLGYPKKRLASHDFNVKIEKRNLGARDLGRGYKLGDLSLCEASAFDLQLAWTQSNKSKSKVYYGRIDLDAARASHQ